MPHSSLQKTPSIADEFSYGSTFSYTMGFLLSVILTLSSYFVVHTSPWHKQNIIWLVAFFAVIQVTIQAVFFLHLNKESKPRWNLLVLFFMIMVTGIIVSGSLWIMTNLTERTMSEKDMNMSVIHKEQPAM